jgi:hypothetical protein
MKIFGFESLMPAPGVEALVLKPQEVPLDAVLRDRLAGVDPTCGFDPLAEFGTSMPPTRFGIRGKSGEVDWHTGFLVYIHDKDLAEFLAGPFVPESGSRLESQLSPCQSKKRRMALLLEFLKRHRNPPSSMIGSKERRDLDAGLLGFTIRNRKLQAIPLTPRKNGRSYFANAHDACSVVAERRLSYGCFDIPRLVRAWTGPNLNPEGVSWFDGESFGFAETLDQLPPALYRELDEHGRFDGPGSRQPLPYPPIEPVALLRVPGRDQIRGGPPAAPERPFDRPLYLFDAEEPLPLPEGLPVIADPTLAYAVAARSPNGIFVPGDLASKPLSISKDPKWYLVAGLRA